jgi:hypothetical protein
MGRFMIGRMARQHRPGSRGGKSHIWAGMSGQERGGVVLAVTRSYFKDEAKIKVQAASRCLNKFTSTLMDLASHEEPARVVQPNGRPNARNPALAPPTLCASQPVSGLPPARARAQSWWGTNGGSRSLRKVPRSPQLCARRHHRDREGHTKKGEGRMVT